MRNWAYTCLAVALAMPVSALSAAVREVDSAELREIVAGGQSISLKRVIEAVTKSTGAQAIEARAFEADGIIYRIVLKKPNGSLVSVIIDAQTGQQISKDSTVGRQVDAKATSGSGNREKKDKPAQGGGGGNANGGNGNGNGGGNGGGGGGGGGGGNGGGNGNGNGNG